MALGCLLAGALLLSDVAGAQQPPSPLPQQPSAPQALPSKDAPLPANGPVPTNRPGFIDALGRLIDNSVAGMKAGIDSARDKIGGLGEQASGAARGAADAATGVAKGAVDVATGMSDAAAEAAKGAAEAAKGAADSVVRMPATRMVAGRERCGSAPNGAPDCRAAADQLCRSNGFGQGNSLDMQSTEKCPARVYISGRQSESDCRMEHFITRAMCQ